MGIKGLQGFVQNQCLNVCSTVNLRTLAKRHMSSYPDCAPTVVVDAMCCLRTWYTPNGWVHGGQWKEYLDSLHNFITAFKNAGIRLVFVFDGVIEEKKRAEWVKRRLQNNKEVSKIFSFVKSHRQQPGRNMFFIPSGISTFTRFALMSLGQEIICSQVEGDYEVAAYALKHNCLGILGEDSDYLIFNTAPYFSINKLCLDNLVTLMYSRESFCGELGLGLSDLPLLACLLGNDIVPEKIMESFHRKCMASYPSHGNKHNKANVIRAVASFISSIQLLPHGLKEVEKMLYPGFDMTLLQKGIESYVLPQQSSPWIYSRSQPFEGTTYVCQDQEIVQIALCQHYKGENSMICNVLCLGVSDCSNTLEDENDPQIPGQALVFRTARQHIYAILLGTGNGSPGTCPIVHEWYVYPGNLLQRPDLVPALPLSIPGGTPTARRLWLSEEPDIQRQRFYTCLACFNVERWTEEFSSLSSSLAVTCCLLVYIAVQVDSLSLTDVEAFLAQALVLPGISASQLKSLQLPYVDSRAVHLAFLYLRGLVTLMGANCACSYPFKMVDLMPWNTFDGKLFHQKYLQCHRQRPLEEILTKTESIAQFMKLRTMITDACAAQNRILQPGLKSTSGPLPGKSGEQSHYGPQSEHESERNEWQSVRKKQPKDQAMSGSFYNRYRQCNPPHEHRGKINDWSNISRHQAGHQEQWSQLDPLYEYEGRGNLPESYEYGRYNPGQRSWHRGQRRRGHQFSNQ
ncbi:constitutive coactivator of peroxisome proliferator-activated receptor gamma isoform X2 [Pseudophryne corroboree]|uniref:constitutive coactivator of peroxisome proliferator-activated receptor gamma isoform X2 n=1 Tax=Pseudophryne corroboree TaxID=495146 RepID=UPI00308213FC